jgi:predicted acylesterase/phospholipase RssA
MPGRGTWRSECVGRRRGAGLVFGGIVTMSSACSSPTRLAGVPREVQNSAEIPGLQAVRYFSPNHLDDLIREGRQSFDREQAVLRAAGRNGPLPPVDFLAISGGGEDGAFGAGLLVGWSATGKRPRFKVVTGVSTGALAAPFAFLGPEYDAKLKWIYTEVSGKDVSERRGLLAALFADALTDSTPLKRLVQRFMNAELAVHIAAEYAKGRLLFIGTTNLDARRGVIWNIGRIAASGHPRAVELIQDVLVASAAVPGVFPPVMIDVEVNGQRYQEMHVDGGAVAQAFIYPPVFNLARESRAVGAVRQRRMYIIRNARLDAEWAEVNRRTLDIASRSISTLIHSQGIGDLYRMYMTSGRDGVDFNLAIIPETFTMPLAEPFDRGYMNALFDVGYDLGRRGYAWMKVVPGLEGPPRVVDR